MFSRLILSLVAPLLTVPLLPAQSKPTTKPDKLQQEVTGVEETAADRVAKLKAELKKVDNELNHINQLKASGGMVGHVQRALGLRSNKYRTFAPARPAPRRSSGGKVRKITEVESQELPAGSRLLIDGQPVTNQEYEDVYSFLKTYVRNDAAARKLTIHNLALQKAAIAENQKAANANRKRLKLAHTRLVEGEMWDRVVKELSDCPSMEKNGDLGFLKRSDRDPMFMKRAFALEPGDRSEVFAATEGYHVLECLAKKEDAVHVRHILVRYSDQVPKVHALVRRGSVDIASSEAIDIDAKAKGVVRKPAPVAPGNGGVRINKDAKLQKAKGKYDKKGN